MLLLVGTGCTTLKRTALNRAGDALAAGGSVYASDDDPELVRAAAPFSLKLIESLLASTPRHPGLLLAASRGFTQYAYAFVQQEADETEASDVAGARERRARARRLFLRGRDYGLRGLEAAHADFRRRLEQDPTATLAECEAGDVPLLYWTAAAWCAAIAITKDRPDLIAELPQAEAMVDRALAVDERFGQGAIHVFLISYEMSRPGGIGDPEARARPHFDRAIELSGGQAVAPYVSWAEAVCLARQDRAGFEAMLRKALEVDADRAPASRLENLVLQRRARWLLGRADELFLPAVEADLTMVGPGSPGLAIVPDAPLEP